MNEEILNEEESAVLILTDENGQDVEFEYLDSIDYEGKEYLVLMPADEMATEIVILEVEPVDEENENYLSVSDEAVLDAVYGIFKARSQATLPFEASPPPRRRRGSRPFSPSPRSGLAFPWGKPRAASPPDTQKFPYSNPSHPVL